MSLRTLITDDEPLARERMVSLLRGESGVEIVAQAANGKAALEIIARQPIDLVFLDIQMPEMNGFEMVKRIAPHRMPAIVFVTVYDQYALAAFDVHALDYLLKPVAEERLHIALQHARSTRVPGTELHQRIASMVAEMEARRSAPERILLKSDGEIGFYDPEEIDWIECAGNYVTLHMGGKNKFLRESLRHLESKLRPYGFVRISRSAVVNTARIRTMKSVQFGDYNIQLRDNTQLILSRGYREAFFQLVDGPS